MARTSGALRFDDALRVAPANLVLKPEGLALKLTSAKTTGLGKRVEAVTSVVLVHSYLAYPDWLEHGPRLLWNRSV